MRTQQPVRARRRSWTAYQADRGPPPALPNHYREVSDEIPNFSKRPSSCEGYRGRTAASPECGHQPPPRVVAACLMGQGSVALLPRLDGAAVEHQIAGEDPRASSSARTLTQLGIANPSDWQGGVPRYLLDTLERWITLHGGDAIQEQFSSTPP